MSFGDKNLYPNGIIMPSQNPPRKVCPRKALTDSQRTGRQRQLRLYAYTTQSLRQSSPKWGVKTRFSSWVWAGEGAQALSREHRPQTSPQAHYQPRGKGASEKCPRRPCFLGVSPEAAPSQQRAASWPAEKSLRSSLAALPCGSDINTMDPGLVTAGLVLKEQTRGMEDGDPGVWYQEP